MTPIAAYYVMITTEQELAARKRRFAVTPPARESLVERILEGLETLVRLGRPATVQPI